MLGTWGPENGELLPRYRFSILQNEKSSGDWMHKNVNVLTLLNLQMVTMVNFMLCILSGLNN